MAVVVVGYVPKPEGEAALLRAIEEARLRSADLIVVDSHPAVPDDTHEPTRTGARVEPDVRPDVRPGVELRAARVRLAASGLTYQVRSLERGCEAAGDLLGVAQAHDAELIVIGLRRRSPVGKLVLGAQAQRILLEARCPVLAVKAANETADAAPVEQGPQ